MPSQPVVARDIMVTRLITLRPDMEVFDAIEMLLKYRISGAPVVDEAGHFMGVFSEGNAINLLLDSARDEAETVPIEGYIDRLAPTVTPETDLLTIAQTFQRVTARRLPVLDNRRLVGQVSRRDLLKAAGRLVEMGRSEASSVLYLTGDMAESDSGVLMHGHA
jgi:CBS domain-containing protein